MADMAWHMKREALARQRVNDALVAQHLRHQVVCRYWIADRCMSGGRCAFLHEYKLDKFPLCAYIEGACPDRDACMFRHHYLPGERRQQPRYDPSRQLQHAPKDVVTTNNYPPY